MNNGASSEPKTGTALMTEEQNGNAVSSAPQPNLNNQNTNNSPYQDKNVAGNVQHSVLQTNQGISNSQSTQPSTVNNTELIFDIDQGNSGGILQDSSESIIQKIRNEKIQAIDEDINALKELIEARRAEIIETANTEWQEFIKDINDHDTTFGDEKPKRRKSASTKDSNSTKSRVSTTTKPTAGEVSYIRGQVSTQAKTFFKEQYKKLTSQGKSSDAALKRIQTLYMKAKINPTPGKSYTIESIRKVVGAK